MAHSDVVFLFKHYCNGVKGMRQCQSIIILFYFRNKHIWKQGKEYLVYLSWKSSMGCAAFCRPVTTMVPLPPTGTLISAFAVLCGARSDLISERGVCCVFWLNVAAAFIQLLTAVIMVGWIMSIFWGMDMVILASQYACVCMYVCVWERVIS